jgi:hypothetical protein
MQTITPNGPLACALAKPWIRDTPIAGTTFGALLDAQPRFQFVRDAKGPHAVPASTAGAAMLADAEHGPTMQAGLDAIRGMMEHEGGRPSLGAMALSTNVDGMIANELAEAISTRSSGAALESPTAWNQFVAATQKTWEPLRRAATSNVCNYVAPSGPGVVGSIVISPGLSSSLRAAWSGGTLDGVGTLTGTEVLSTGGLAALHEMLHSISPPIADTPAPRHADNMGFRVDWLEEGITEALTERPGHLDEFARRGNLPPLEAPFRSYVAKIAPIVADGLVPPYRDFSETVRRLTRLAGVDLATDPARASELLNGRQVRFVPGRLAAAIVEQHHLAPDRYRWVRDRINQLHGSPAKVDALAADIAALTRQS